MSEYICTTRTNYFHVKDPEAFTVFMGRVYGTLEPVSLWREQDDAGQLVFGFGTYGAIAGLKKADADDDPLDETAYGEFIQGLQEQIAEDDAVILLESGHEKLRYVTGSAAVLTEKECVHIDLSDIAARRASELLGAPGWKPRCEY